MGFVPFREHLLISRGGSPDANIPKKKISMVDSTKSGFAPYVMARLPSNGPGWTKIFFSLVRNDFIGSCFPFPCSDRFKATRDRNYF